MATTAPAPVDGVSVMPESPERKFAELGYGDLNLPLLCADWDNEDVQIEVLGDDETPELLSALQDAMWSRDAERSYNGLHEAWVCVDKILRKAAICNAPARRTYKLAMLAEELREAMRILPDTHKSAPYTTMEELRKILTPPPEPVEIAKDVPLPQSPPAAQPQDTDKLLLWVADGQRVFLNMSATTRFMATRPLADQETWARLSERILEATKKGLQPDPPRDESAAKLDAAEMSPLLSGEEDDGEDEETEQEYEERLEREAELHRIVASGLPIRLPACPPATPPASPSC